MEITLIKLPDKILRKKSIDVAIPLSDKYKKIADAMIKYIDDSQKPGFEHRAGVGIAANQVGFNLNMFYVNIPLDNGGQFREFILNPKIIGESPILASLKGGEGCLSVKENHPGTDGFVHRKFKVVISGYSYLKQTEIKITKSGYPAVVLQHEMDHLEGKLFFDRINKKNIWHKNDDEEII